MPVSRFFVGVLSATVSAALTCALAAAAENAAFRPTVELVAPATVDQDDGCVWVDRADPSRSTIIASDKSAGRVFVYDLEGKVLQTLEVTKPGNIDIRQQVRFGEKSVDLIVVNQRANGFKLVVFSVDPATRQLVRLDDERCTTGPNYGGCLYHSAKSGRLFFICTSEVGTVEQYELKAAGERGVTATKVRTLAVGFCEGAVADDKNGDLFIGEEKKGIWKFSAEPDGAATGELIARVGEQSLQGDVEGLALVESAQEGSGGYLVASDQGRSRFRVYRREAPHKFVGEFAIEGATDTDGIDICAANLGPGFPRGLFLCHTDRQPRGLLATPWSPIADWLAKLK